MIRAALLLILLGALAGCSWLPGPGGDPFQESEPRSQFVTLEVHNLNSKDATIHIVWAGARRRLGMVTAKTSQTFKMEWRREHAWVEVDFVAGGRYMTEELPVDPGDDLEMWIEVWRRDE